jgi:two-component system, chemotaxis family, chemotaxis protein CheY
VTTQSNTVPTERTANAFRPFEPRPRILVIDADDDTRALYREAFQLSGCDVVEASDGRDGLTKASMNPPCLVVTAIRLPLLDGYALCQILRRDHATAGIPILVVTAEVGSAQLDRVRKAGADVVLAKPTTPEHILSEARRLLAEMKAIDGGTVETKDSAAERPATSASEVTHFGQRQRAVSVKSQSTATLAFAAGQPSANPRFATTPCSASPPSLICPSCDRRLTYLRSHIGGVHNRRLEQWDYYTCPACGTFQYRQGTRKLRCVDSVPY